MTRSAGARSAGSPRRRPASDPGPDRAERGGRTPAQLYCLLGGLALLLAGIFGFLADGSFDVGDTLGRASFLGFDVNGWHNLVHLASGLLLLSVAGKRRTARTTAIAFGLVYGGVAVIGLIDGRDVLGLIPVDGADNVLHVALSGLGIIAGAVSRPKNRVRR